MSTLGGPPPAAPAEPPPGDAPGSASPRHRRLPDGLRQPRTLAGMAIVLAVVLALSAVLVARSRSGSTASPTGQTPSASNAHQASLADAIAHATVIGPTNPAMKLHITLTLENKAGQQLSSLIAAGQSVSPSQFAAQFGPDPRAVQAAIAELHRIGVDATWNPGSSILVVTAPVSVINQVLNLTITDYRSADGKTFYAPDKPVIVPPQVNSVITGVAGLDNYTSFQGKSIRLPGAIHAGGITPDEVVAFYNIAPLRNRGLDGSGVTIVFPELDDLPDDHDLQAFSRAHNLPAADLTIKHDPAWGDPEKPGQPGGEATLDVEVAHAIAPKAKLIAYVGSGRLSESIVRDQTMVRDNPGAIISNSLGQCEAGLPDTLRTQSQSVWDQAAATGMTHMVASGDNGAYDCNGKPDVLSPDFPSALPSVTAVGGTSIFLGSKPGYFREVAWGDAIAGVGSGGGASQNYQRPDWQKGQGVDNGDSLSPATRQVPDIAGVADTNTGWDILQGGADVQVGGTSAAAPLWAGIVALVDQDLQKNNLKPVGFANPAIYWMAQQSDLNPPPFHDLTIGNNFRYKATAGWDFVTGWGTPDVDALDQAWQKFQRQGGG